MKITLLLFFTTCLNLWANDGYSQKMKITMDLENAPVEKILDEIEGASEFRFIYNVKDVDLTRKTSIKVNKEKIDKLLNRLFSNTSTSYKVNGKQIILVPKRISSSSSNLKMQSQQTVTGTVRGTSGMPLPGVTVYHTSKRFYNVTTHEGTYAIDATPKDTLIFSHIGYKSQKISVGNKLTIDVVLQEDIASLNEVLINAGYYNTTKRESTGNISRVTAEELENQPLVSPIQALQGRMAGVEIIPGGSQPGMASTIRIRGINSLREEGNYPLYIIDGVPINSAPLEAGYSILDFGSSPGIDPLNNLNVSNIESIEVLKDADATAIYGSRGANGVVLITTKRGSKSGSGLEASFSLGAGTVPDRLDLLNTEQYLDIRRRAFENDGVEPDENNAYDLILWDQDRYTDWQDFAYGGIAETLNTNISFSGGGEKTFFRVGGSYFSQGTVYQGNYDYKRVTGNFNLNHTSANDKFNINLSTSYGVDFNNTTGFTGLNSLATLPPNAPSVFNEDGTLNWEDWAVGGIDNPLEGYFDRSEILSNSLISNLAFSYQIIGGLKIKSSFGYNYYDIAELSKRPKRSYNPSEVNFNYSFHSGSKRKSWIVEPQLLYNKQFDKLNLETIVGATFQESTNDFTSFQGSGYASEALIGNIAAAEDILNARNGNTDYRYAALFSRIGLNWDRKYYLNLTGRRDGSSRFGPNNRFANFGAIGSAWIFSEEKFIQTSLPFLSFGKFRGSYGTTGNDQIGDYGYLDAYEATRGTGGLYPTGLSNPDYSWEVNKKLEAAMELGFFEDRFRVGASWYRNRSSNQLVGHPLPYITGFTTVQANLPATVQNSGWEFEANTENINSGNFHWQTSFNISFPKNELLNYPDIEQSSFANTYRVGQPLNIRLYYEYTGLDPETGLYTVKDINEDGRLDFQDQNIVQDFNREFYGGLNNSISYKGFSLQFLLSFAKQEGTHTSFFAGRPSNELDIVLEALENENRFQQISYSLQSRRAFQNIVNTSFMVSDASYLRLQTLTLGYNLPTNLLEKIGINRGKLSLHGQNLWVITPYKGLAPENPISLTSYNGMRTVTAGLDINL